jgi:signal peptidase
MTDTTRVRRTMGARVGSVLLTIAAAGGVICILLVLLAVFFHITLIMFKTGSMSPTIPQGSLAVVRQIPATEIKVGDVVTVTRAGELPISHRVVSIANAGSGTRTITLRGDANPVDDPLPYTVTSARLVMWSVPQLAYFVVWLSNPFVIGGIAIGAAALVTWAFWPSGAPRKHRGSSASTTLVAIFVAGGVAALSQSLGAQPARAATIEQTISGSAITLVSIGDPAEMGALDPGVPTLWQVGVSAHAANPGTIELSLLAQGPLSEIPTGLALSVSSCDVRWVNDLCASGEQTLLAQQAASDLGGSAQHIGSMTTAQQRWLLIRASVPSSNSVSSGTATVQLSAAGVGDVETAGGGNISALPMTGVGDLWPALGIAAAAVGAGLALAGGAALLRRSRTDMR